MRRKVTGSELDVGEMTQACRGRGEGGGGSIAAGRKAVCRDHMESCNLTIWIYELTASHDPDPVNMLQIH